MTLAELLISTLKIVGLISVVLPLIAYSVVAERRISAAIQDRVGPNRVGPFGLLQPLADGVKFLLKEDFTPSYVNKVYFWMAPALAMIPSFVVFAVIPFGSMLFGEKMVVADLNVGILFTFAIVSLSVYGIVLAGYASNSKYPFLGGIRSSAQMISYEIAMGMSVIPLFMLTSDPVFFSQGLSESWNQFLMGTSDLNLSRIIAYQSGSFFDWLIFKQPLAFIIFLAAAFAETNRLPFDLPESETELVAGYHTEYSSMKFALFFLGEYAAMIAASSLMVVLFLGGWSLPLWGLDQPADNVFLGLLHIIIFFSKVSLFMVFFIWIRWTLPRFRYDQLMNLGWKRFLPLSLANIIVTAIWLWFKS
ncbi:MAG: NADH-quinone oxidoreductase subunit H [Verrucomicrobia bacterium]|nr:NADH-quinone oxidoreductase subunit H [Verrucomicrobiota bacterium]